MNTSIQNTAQINVHNDSGKVIASFSYNPVLDESPLSDPTNLSYAQGVLNRLPTGLDIRDAMNILSNAFGVLSSTLSEARETTGADVAQAEEYSPGTWLCDCPECVDDRQASNEQATDNTPTTFPVASATKDIPDHVAALLSEMGIDLDNVEVFRI